MSVTHEDRMRAHLWVREALHTAVRTEALKAGLESPLLHVVDLYWSDRMGKSMGLASYTLDLSFVKLSTVLWKVASEEEKRETVYHEVAHLVVYDNHFRSKPRRTRLPAGHGPEWKWVMHKIGYSNPSSKHTILNEEYERERGRVPLFCGCRTAPTFFVSSHKAVVMAAHTKKGKPYFCRKCRKLIQIGDRNE